MHTPPPNFFPLPEGLPVPIDDGAADHLPGRTMPAVSLPSTSGGVIHLARMSCPRTVLYFYPMTGVPGKPLPEGWDLIPGARGCTPQTCGFRDHYHELADLRTAVFGVSTQPTEYQTELAGRLHLPFAILSDSEFKLCDALDLPTFRVEGVRLFKRLTVIILNGRIEKVFYPVFPPNESADQVLRWLRQNPYF